MSVFRIIGAGYWRSDKAIMKSTIKYADEPIGQPKVLKDFLPSPDELAFREEDAKITITLSKQSVAFFKAAAVKSDTQYQRTIRRLLTPMWMRIANLRRVPKADLVRASDARNVLPTPGGIA